ncbi:hypothetical protein P2G88_11635 [Aliiglaciecola sp. CAU 1673]|uniref:hypothetical protein n=1 Tax=Aliiglaciecola sp. CAU 1673 TaxID=3032595 RepID=UPI0023DC0631|nr:hypothetical protein [Aliiglaciecola sp. CAU 1673]MDF2178901.1 hypothetical protein [Aliiglaciecola sp. CAU 1673]
MDRLRMLSWGAFMIFLGALFYGVRDLGTPILALGAKLYLYLAFIFFLRFKMALDDHFYFGVTAMKRWQSVSGFFVGVLSWFFYIFAGYSLSSIADSYLLLLLAMAVSTLWIVVTAIKDGFYREQKIWLATNAIYMGGLGFLLWSESAAEDTTGEWLESLLRSDVIAVGVLILLLGTAIIDFRLSKSMEHAGH